MKRLTPKVLWLRIGVVAGYATGLINTAPYCKYPLCGWASSTAGWFRLTAPAFQVLITGMSLGVYFGSQWVLQDYETVPWPIQKSLGISSGDMQTATCFASALAANVTRWRQDCWRASPPFGTCRTGGTILSAMHCGRSSSE